MILQALASYYDVLAQQGKVGRPGWGTAKVIGALCLDEQGNLIDILSLKTANAKGKEVATVRKVPEQKTRSSGFESNFLCDGLDRFLGFSVKADEKRAKKCFDAAAALHLQLLEGVDSVAAKAVFAFFTNWNPNAEHPILAEHEDLLKEAGNFLFRIDGMFAQEDPAIQAAWESYRSQGTEDGVVMQCAVTGQKATVARVHTRIKGVCGAQSSGAALVSFNDSAFTSYGQKQSYNAPVSEQAMFAYTTALNYLLSSAEHTRILGDTTVVAWSANDEPQCTNLGWNALEGGTKATVDDGILQSMFEELSHGRPYAFGDVTIDPNEPFYILGLAPNAARLSVRFFWRNTFGHFMKNVQAHYKRLEIVRPAQDEREYLSIGSLLGSLSVNKKDDYKPAAPVNKKADYKPAPPVNEKDDYKSAPPVLLGGLIRAILNDTPYPAALRSAVMLRIRAERKVSRGRAALLKAILLKNPAPIEGKEICTVALNEESTYTPYVLGRLFSVLETIQSDADTNNNKKINTTIKDRFFNSAAATPAIIFPRLTQLAQAHLRKLRVGKKREYEEQLIALHEKLPEVLPARLSLAEQESFFIGYYHQRQKHFEKKEKADSVKEKENDA